jgi:hypothetical protein
MDDYLNVKKGKGSYLPVLIVVDKGNDGRWD